MGPKFKLGALRPSHAPSGKIFTSEKSILSKFSHVDSQLFNTAPDFNQPLLQFGVNKCT